MIVGLSSLGEVYLSLTQVNTDQDVMMLYLSKLASILTTENRNWREKTIFMLDGASWHLGSETRKMYQDLGVKIIVSAPYSY